VDAREGVVDARRFLSSAQVAEDGSRALMASTAPLAYCPHVAWSDSDWRVVIGLAAPAATVVVALVAGGGTTARLQRMIRFEIEIRKQFAERDPLGVALTNLTRARVATYVDRFMTAEPLGVASRDRRRELWGYACVAVAALLSLGFLLAFRLHASTLAQWVLVACGAVMAAVGGVLLGPTAHRRVIHEVREDYVSTNGRLDQEVFKQQADWPAARVDPKT
jgi:hypothetical protein